MIGNIPVVEVNRDNLSTFWPSIILNIRNASFLALDAELSGLGDRKRLNAKSIDDRYKSISEAATSRSILSLGISIFAEIEDEQCSSTKTKKHLFKTQTYNCLTLCDDDFVVEPGAVRFLVEHGFDFNLQYAKGLPYRRRGFGKSIGKEPNVDRFTFQDLFAEILKARKPVVFHNGMVDLIFLYGNFLADLPSTLQIFVADIAELFPGGVYDTKFVADYCARYTASYLEYIFRKCQRENEAEANAGRYHIDIRLPNFTPNIEQWVEWAACCPTKDRSDSVDNLCSCFAAHGWCKEGRSCSLSHDVDSILDLEEMKLEKKRAKKRRRQNAAEGDVNESTDDGGTKSKSKQNHNGNTKPENGQKSTSYQESQKSIADQEMENSISDRGSQDTKSLPYYTGAHRAGYDAFMTAFSMTYLTLKLNQWPNKDSFDVATFKNKIALSGKDYPLFIQRSAFTKSSQNVQEIIKQLSS